MRIRLTVHLMATAALVVLLAAAGGAASSNSGSLDAGFTSFPGRVTTAIGSGDDDANAVAVQSDGKIVAAGKSYNGTDDDFALVRYKTTGLLNTSFGTGGKVTTDFGSGNDVANAVTVKASGKIVVAGRAYNGTDNDFAVARYNSDGSPDTSFSGDGRLMTDFGSGDDVARAVAVDSNGKIVVAGNAYNGTDNDFALARYDSDGTPDTSFSGDGLKMTDFGSGDDYAYALVIQSDGKIVVAGYADNGTNDDFALARYDTGGGLDNGFSGDGMKMTDFGANEFAYALALQSNGSLVAAGSAYNGSNDDFALARYDTGGGLENSFSDDGMKTVDFGSGNDVITGLAIQSDGKIVAGGYAFNGSDYDFAVARFQPDGGLDNNFSGDGMTVTDFLGSDDYALGLALQSDGKIVAAGSADNGTNDDFALARYKAADGSLDAAFTTVPGMVTTAIGSGDDDAAALAKQSDGKLVAAGWSYNGTDNDFALVRYKSDGTLDPSFDTDGKVTTAIGAGNDVGQAVAIKSNGKIIVAGRAYNGTDDDFAVARYNPDGSPDTSFGGGDGKLMTDFGSGSDGGQAITLQPDGKFVVAGYAYNGTDYDFALARYNSDGSLDTTFSGDGLKMTDFGSGNDYGYGIVRQPDGKLVVAGSAYNGTNYDFAIARYKSGGGLDASFSADGKKTTDFGSSHDGAFGVVLQGDGKLVAAGYAYNGTNYDFALARYQPDGSLDNNFSGDGMKTTDFGSGDDQANAVVLQSNGKIVAAGQASNGANDDFALARYQSDGSTDTGFSGDGRTTTAFGSADDVASALVRQADDKLVAAGYTDNGTDDDFALARYLP